MRTGGQSAPGTADPADEPDGATTAGGDAADVADPETAVGATPEATTEPDAVSDTSGSGDAAGGQTGDGD